MAIDPETAAAIAANNAEVQAKWNELMEQQQAQFEVQRAQAEAGIYQTMGFNKFGQAADNALFFMQQWQSTFNSRQEAIASGDMPPPSSTDMSLFSDQTDNHWDVIGNGMGNTKDKDEA